MGSHIYKEKTKKILISSTKSVTFNRFLYPICESLNSFESVNIILAVSDIENLDQRLKTYPHKRISYPSRWKEILNPLTIIKLISTTNKFINSENITHIYLHTPVASSFIRLATLFNLINKPEIIYQVHGYRFYNKLYYPKKLIFFMLEFFLSFTTKYYITINQYDFNFSKLLKFWKKKNVYFVNGVGIEKEKISPYFLKNKTKSKPHIIGTIAAYNKEKGYDCLLKTAKILENSNCIFKCFGSGDYKYYQRKSESDNIIFNSFVKEIEEEIAKFEILFLPSQREGLNVSLQEALFLGVPVVTSTARGCIDVVNNEKIKYIFTTDNAHRASELILEIIEMDQLKYNKIRLECVKHASANFDSEVVNKTYINIFSKILNT
tara:strand:- start:4141 stop:5277 length:1137 start_codon:yes stop_codon:yes gene_type:complete